MGEAAGCKPQAQIWVDVLYFSHRTREAGAWQPGKTGPLAMFASGSFYSADLERSACRPARVDHLKMIDAGSLHLEAKR